MILGITLIILFMGVVGATDLDYVAADENSDVLNSVDCADISDSVDNAFIDDAGNHIANDDFEKLDSADEDKALADDDYVKRTHVELNEYGFFDDYPKSVNVNNDSDYVARIYSPKGSAGNVSLYLGLNSTPQEIFTRDIQDLYSEDDGNTTYSYFYIRPNDLVDIIDVPYLYYITVEYKYGLTLSESAQGYVNFVNDSRHIWVDSPDKIIIGDLENNCINIYVEGSKGYLQVLIDGQEIINDSIYNLKYLDELGTFRYYIPVYMDSLPVGLHTYNVSYYGGNWGNESFAGAIDVTCIFDVKAYSNDETFIFNDEFDYGDNVTFRIQLPHDASVNQIKVNGKIYDIDLVYGLGNLTLSEFEFGENVLLFTYNDEKYGVHSVIYSLKINPKLIVPDIVVYGSEDEISLILPSDAEGELNVFISEGFLDWTLKGSADVDGEAHYTFDNWDIGTYYVLVSYEDEKYNVSYQGYIEVVPNLSFGSDIVKIGENASLSIDIGASGLITLFVNGENISSQETFFGKIDFEIPSDKLHLGNNIITLSYEGDDFEFDPFAAYYDYSTEEYVPYEYVLVVEPTELSIPDTLSNDGNDSIVLELPEGSSGNVTVYVNNEQFSTTPVSSGENIISIDGLNAGNNDLRVVFIDNNGYVYEINQNVTVPKSVPLPEVTSPTNSSVPIITVNMPTDATGLLTAKIGGKTYSCDVKNGKATLSIPDLADGTYNLTIIYSGDKNYDGFTKYTTVTIKTSKSVSRFSHNKNINMYYFDGSKYSFKVYGNNGKLVGANQVVTVKINKKTYKVKTNKNGVASFTIPKTVKPGKYTITASYKGKTIKNTVRVKKILSSKKLFKVKRTAKKLVLTAKLKKKLKGKKLTFRFMSKNYYAKTNKNGVAKIIIKKNVIKKLNRGKKYTVKISYFKTSIKTKVQVK